MVSHATAEVLRSILPQGGLASSGHTAPPKELRPQPYVQLSHYECIAGARRDAHGLDELHRDQPSIFADDTSYNGVVTVPSPSKALPRSNEFAAVNAYVRATDFIRRLLACGFAPRDVLPYLTFPLSVRYRGGIQPGGMDGNTVNAQVRWLAPPTLETDANVARPGTAEVSLALADLRLNPKRVPLGIATDARWAWHEWSHVMLAGRSGLLEFPFAHSAGDALAAIICDPDSALADVSASGAA
jgi:hypothetical protein